MPGYHSGSSDSCTDSSRAHPRSLASILRHCAGQALRSGPVHQSGFAARCRAGRPGTTAFEVPTWSAVAEASWPGTVARNEPLVLGYEPSTPLFPCTRDQPQHDEKAVSTSYARKLASDSATALQVQQPADSASHARGSTDEAVGLSVAVLCGRHVRRSFSEGGSVAKTQAATCPS